MSTGTIEKTEAEVPQKDNGNKVAGTRETERYLAPPVDIYEKEDGLVVIADLPGVEKDGVNVQVERGVLTIEAKTSYGIPQDAVQREFGLTNYFRQFELNSEVDQSRISANLKHGVLTIELPKQEQAKPKQIEVKID